MRQAIRSLGPKTTLRELSLPDLWVRYNGAHLQLQATEDYLDDGLAEPPAFSPPGDFDDGALGTCPSASSRSSVLGLAEGLGSTKQRHIRHNILISI